MKSIKYAEKALACIVFLATAIYTFHSFLYLLNLDWQLTTTYYEFINRALLISVGIELVRLLFTHDVHAITDLLVFAVARKLLRPDINTQDLIIYVIAFAILVLVDATIDKLTNKYTKNSSKQ